MKKVCIGLLLVPQLLWGMWPAPLLKYSADLVREKTESQDPSVFQQQMADQYTLSQSSQRMVMETGVKSSSSKTWQVEQGIGASHPEMARYVSLRQQGSLGDLLKTQQELSDKIKQALFFMPMHKEKALLASLEAVINEPLTRKLAACAHGTYEQVLVNLQDIALHNKLSGGIMQDDVEQAYDLACKNKAFDPTLCSLIISSPSSVTNGWGYLTQKAHDAMKDLDFNTMDTDTYLAELQRIAEVHGKELTERQKMALVMELIAYGIEVAYTNVKGSEMLAVVRTMTDICFGKLYLPEKEYDAYMDKAAKVFEEFVTAYKNDDRKTLKKGVKFIVDMFTTHATSSKIKKAKRFGAISKALSDVVK